AQCIRRLDVERAVPRRRQEDDGVRAVRTARRKAAGRDRLPDRRRYGPRRDVEGVRRDAVDELDRWRTPAPGERAGRRLRPGGQRLRRRLVEDRTVAAAGYRSVRTARALADRRFHLPARAARNAGEGERGGGKGSRAGRGGARAQDRDRRLPRGRRGVGGDKDAAL